MKISSVATLIIAIFLFLVFEAPNVTSAHPIDLSDTYLYISKEIDNAEIPDNKVVIYSYINWFQAGALVEKEKGIIAQDIQELTQYQDVYNAYFLKRFKLSNAETECSPVLMSAPPADSEISLSLGTRVLAEYSCSSKISKLKIENMLFTDLFETQNNFVYINDGDKLITKKLLTKPENLMSFDYSEYLVSGNVPDDSNGALVSESTSGQDAISDSSNALQINSNKKGYFERIKGLFQLKATDIKNKSIWWITGLVFILGLLHTLEAGHSKVILASSMVSKAMSLKRGLVYATVFTVTHLADILIMGLLLLVASNYVDIYSKFSMLQVFSSYAFFFLALFMLLRSGSNYIKGLVHVPPDPHTHEHDHGHSHALDDKTGFKEQLMIGFVTGLAPCVFGWSIFMLVLSTKNIWTIFPIFLSFGAGIYIALAIVVLVISKFKSPMFSKFSTLSNISPLISSAILVIYGFFLIT